MNERPQIIKQRRRSTPQSITDPPRKEVSSPADSIEQPVEVPTQPERLSALDVPEAPNTPMYSEWWREFELDNRSGLEDDWECDSDDLYMMRDD